MYSVVIPIFNEAPSLRILQKELQEIMHQIGDDYEIIYVDDGSRDNSLEILKELRSKDEHIKVISLARNYGQSVAFKVGFNSAQGDWIITLDGDLQNPPLEIKKLLPFRREYEFIIGVRLKRKDIFFRKLSSQFARFLRWLVLQDTTKDIGCSLRLFHRRVLKDIPFFRNFHRFFPYLVKRMGFKIKEVEIEHNPRRFGKSKYSNLRRATQGLFDLWGVFWLKQRLIRYEIKYR